MKETKADFGFDQYHELSQAACLFMSENGYHQIPALNSKQNTFHIEFVKELGTQPYPRFHLRVESQPKTTQLVSDLHLDGSVHRSNADIIHLKIRNQELEMLIMQLENRSYDPFFRILLNSFKTEQLFGFSHAIDRRIRKKYKFAKGVKNNTRNESLRKKIKTKKNRPTSNDIFKSTDDLPI